LFFLCTGTLLAGKRPDWRSLGKPNVALLN
jgi:hypothetical protein